MDDFDVAKDIVKCVRPSPIPSSNGLQVGGVSQLGVAPSTAPGFKVASIESRLRDMKQKERQLREKQAVLEKEENRLRKMEKCAAEKNRREAANAQSREAENKRRGKEKANAKDLQKQVRLSNNQSSAYRSMREQNQKLAEMWLSPHTPSHVFPPRPQAHSRVPYNPLSNPIRGRPPSLESREQYRASTSVVAPPHAPMSSVLTTPTTLLINLPATGSTLSSTTSLRVGHPPQSSSFSLPSLVAVRPPVFVGTATAVATDVSCTGSNRATKRPFRTTANDSSPSCEYVETAILHLYTAHSRMPVAGEEIMHGGKKQIDLMLWFTSCMPTRGSSRGLDPPTYAPPTTLVLT